jgi:hypothetical protein
MTQEFSIGGTDRAKSVLHLVGLEERGKSLMRKRLRRGAVLACMRTLSPVTVGSRGEEPAAAPTLGRGGCGSRGIRRGLDHGIGHPIDI